MNSKQRRQVWRAWNTDHERLSKPPYISGYERNHKAAWKRLSEIVRNGSSSMRDTMETLEKEHCL